MVSTNGPSGPGNIVRPRKVVAGTDGVAVDTLGTLLLRLPVEQIAMIGMAREHGLGTTRLDDMNIARITL
jgi:uncharacterized protein (DUF362 family)